MHLRTIIAVVRITAPSSENIICATFRHGYTMAKYTTTNLPLDCHKRYGNKIDNNPKIIDQTQLHSAAVAEPRESSQIAAFMVAILYTRVHRPNPNPRVCTKLVARSIRARTIRCVSLCANVKAIA